MPAELPYLASYKNVSALFERIKSAKVPSAFSTAYLTDSLGLKSSTDRPLIALLKTLRFIDTAGRPQPSYSLLKNDRTARAAIADAVRAAYEPLFASNEKANELSNEELRGLVAQVAGTEEGVTGKIAGTFRALVAQGDFHVPRASTTNESADSPADSETQSQEQSRPELPKKTSMRPDFHYNIQVHLPANGTEETYRNIFNAIREVFR